MPWENRKQIGSVMQRLKKEKFLVVALEQSEMSLGINAFSKTLKKRQKEFHGIALMVGNEVQGVSPLLLKKCDAVVDIPMMGKKESLNVSVATGIALYSLVFHG